MQVLKSAGGVVFKDGLVLVRRPSPNPNYKARLGWSFPKGIIDPGETPEVAAVREVAEEAGVAVKIVAKIKTVKTFYSNPEKEKFLKFITYYKMDWQADLPEGFGWETAETRWMTVDQAIHELAYPTERELLMVK